MAAMAFAQEAGGQRKPVRASPHLLDAPQRLPASHVLPRARQWVAQSRFEPRGGPEGAFGLVGDLMRGLVMQPLEPGHPFRQDWHNTDIADTVLGQLHLEEVVLAVDAEVTLAGHWNAARQAFTIPDATTLPTLVAATAEGSEALQRQGWRRRATAEPRRRLACRCLKTGVSA
jgi:hypothetical protein